MGLNETNGGECCFQSSSQGLQSLMAVNPDTSKSPRGVRGFMLDTGTFTEWKVQGKIGGYTKYVCHLMITRNAEVTISNFLAILTKFAVCV